MAKPTIKQERLHAQASQLIDLHRDLTEEERAFVLEHWRASSTSRSASDRAYFTPAGLAREMAIHVSGRRVVDLAAGIGRLAFHCRDLWTRQPDPGRDLVCIERNHDYVRVGRRVMPEARWIRADIMTIPRLREQLGEFDCAIANPPFGAIPRAVQTTRGYSGRRFEYHAIALAGMIASRGVFLIPQVSAPFCYSGIPGYRFGGDREYRKFSHATGIALEHNAGVDTTYYREDWQDVVPTVEIVIADFTERTTPASRPGAAAALDGQLSLLAA